MSDITQENTIYSQIRKITRRILKGRWYIKDFEAMGAKITLTPHCTDMGHHQYLYGCTMEINGKEYYLIARETPFLSKYFYAVNGIKHPGIYQRKAGQEVIDFFNKAYMGNKNGIRTHIIRRSFYIITGQIGMLISFLATPLLLTKFFFTNMIKELALGGISFGIFMLCLVMIILAKKDSRFGGK